LEITKDNYGKCKSCYEMEGAHYDYASKLCVDDCGDGKVMIGSKNGCDDGNT